MQAYKFILYFALSTAIPTPCFSALPANDTSAIQFYRFKDSLFPSGQASLHSLRSAAIKTELRVDFLAKWNNQEHRIPGQSLWRDLQLSEKAATADSTPLYSQKNFDRLPIKNLKGQSVVSILEADEFWAQVKTNDGQIGFTPLENLKTLHDDPGFFISLIDTHLRKSSSMNSPSLRVIKASERFKALKIENSFVQIQKDGITGYAPLAHFVSKADLATWAYSEDTQWSEVKYRQGAHLVLKKGGLIELTSIKGMVTKPQWGIVRKTLDNGPIMRSRVEILKPEAYYWTLSTVKGHGEVWWKNTRVQQTSAKLATHKGLNIDDLLKRELYSVAFENKNSLKGLVSSDGVYRSTNGKDWEKISLFENKNYPVAIHPEGAWFVGSYISYDNGQSFEPFIRWDKLSATLESKMDRPARIIKITKIEPLKDNQVQIQVDTGGKVLVLKSKLGKWDWN